MKNKKLPYHGIRFAPEIISHAVWLYHRFCLSLRDVEELLAEHGITVTYESIRQWCNHFRPEYTRTLKNRGGRLGDDWYLDEVFIKIQGELHYLWRAVDQDGNTIDFLVQRRRNETGCKALLPQAIDRSMCISKTNDNRQTEELFCRAPRGDAVGSAQY